jgi:Transglycosylase SLT domain
MTRIVTPLLAMSASFDPLVWRGPCDALLGMRGQGLSSTPKRGGKAPPSHGLQGSVVQQVGGLVMLLLVIVPGYVMSRPVSDEWPEAPAVLGRSRPSASNETRVPTAVIAEHIREVGQRYGVSEALIASIIAVESEYNPRAVSRKGARGLMQLMPATATSLSVDDPFDPRENIEAGVRHLKRLMDRFDNNLPLVLAAYNAGEQAVLRYRGVPPYRETRQYVARVLRKVERAQPGSVPVRPGPTRVPPRNGFRASLEPPGALLVVPVAHYPGLTHRAGLLPNVVLEPPVPAAAAEGITTQGP